MMLQAMHQHASTAAHGPKDTRSEHMQSLNNVQMEVSPAWSDVLRSSASRKLKGNMLEDIQDNSSDIVDFSPRVMPQTSPQYNFMN